MSKTFTILAFCLGLVSLATAKPNIDGRILNGAEAAEGAFPYQVSIRKDENHFCGGSIISNRYVLSAAHCVGYNNTDGKFVLYNSSTYTIRAGSNERLSGGVIVNVAEMVAHEDYYDSLHDLSVLRLETPLIFSNKIKPITLARNEVPIGAKVIISGWGRLSTNGDLATKLQWSTSQVMARSACYNEIDVDSADIICLARPVNNGACYGDSGGAAVYESKLVGVASFVVGDGCGTAYPDGYTKISTHLDWIKKHSGV